MFAGVCGVTTRGDPEAAVEAAVDAMRLGFVITSRRRFDLPKRPRCVALAPAGADRRGREDQGAADRLLRMAWADDDRHTA